MSDIFSHRNIPLLTEPNVLVIGAGSEGCVAAFSAAAYISPLTTADRYDLLNIVLCIQYNLFLKSNFNHVCKSEEMFGINFEFYFKS